MKCSLGSLITTLIGSLKHFTTKHKHIIFCVTVIIALTNIHFKGCSEVGEKVYFTIQ